uniref:Ketoreductase domain-containing protein n=1 Tax=Chromera velia CCMP2878 TaxID=1169474 RepID=A0A0G4GQ77_9ALVE|mmetsp:Transcript_8467/g.16487  ORF Transcript_8467/g.16487 Transcript_8467/m.16487 type:complete len:282 (-) Transcript_8467:618-1463(-)|eukprot:Cvel_728.t1-p1 / transcript=Cvel_728.t1 / gene=Cvel_728 / organism=Chromera_velia_CCMP2878 / gene_product=Monensin polyketide synthase putative ketoacyl, putative / transcript_product=Monensin polyketide synthase putative ketoacyl, putative / location=Cvel_scaffold22:154299-155141(-) / protein_length=281 / sequence_SO=supercontig / SO=protein_coding / is_pseudo=false
MSCLNGKVAVITGGGTGIGLGIASDFLKGGAKLVIAGRRLEKLQEAAETLSKKSAEENDKKTTDKAEIECVQCDVRDQDSCKALIEAALQRFGRVDVLVNNAGIEGSFLEVEHASEKEWDDIFDTNVRSNFYLSKAVIPHFRKRFEESEEADEWEKPLHTGSIIVVASIAGKIGQARIANYVASNFARIGFAKSLALELAPIRVTVNALCPGVVWTPMWARMVSRVEGPEDETAKFTEKVNALIPMQRPQTEEDMGRLATFMATQPNLTAQEMYVDGGYVH